MKRAIDIARCAGMGVLTATASAHAFANSTRVNQLLQSLIGSVGALYYTITGLFVLIGVLVTWKSLVGLYRLADDTQQRGMSPLGCIVGIVVGGALTTVGVVAAIAANTLES
jgi:hypothetical protein